MPKEINERTIRTLPEAFYDIIAYIIPSVYLVVGIVFSLKWSYKETFLNKLILERDWVKDLFLGFFILGGLYIVGLTVTTMSFFIIFKPLYPLFGYRKYQSDSNSNITLNDSKKMIPKNNYSKKLQKAFDQFDKEYMEIKILHTEVSHEITKRYARWVSIRNIAFLSLVLAIINIFMKNNFNFILFIVVFIITFIDSCVRRIWIEQNINDILSIKKIDN